MTTKSQPSIVAKVRFELRKTIIIGLTADELSDMMFLSSLKDMEAKYTAKQVPTVEELRELCKETLEQDVDMPRFAEHHLDGTDPQDRPENWTITVLDYNFTPDQLNDTWTKAKEGTET